MLKLEKGMETATAPAVASRALFALGSSSGLVIAVSLQIPVDVHLFSENIGNDNACRQSWRDRVHVSAINLNCVKDGEQISPHNLLHSVGLRHNRCAISTSNLITTTP